MSTDRKPLTRCPVCGSRLLQALEFVALEDGREVVERRCPECEHADTVVTSALAASVWRRREIDLHVGLAAHLVVLGAEALLAAVADAGAGAAEPETV